MTDKQAEVPGGGRRSPTALLVNRCDRDDLCRYFKFLLDAKQQVCRDVLTWNQLQEGIDSVNSSVEAEYERMEHTRTHTHAHSTQVNQMFVMSSKPG